MKVTISSIGEKLESLLDRSFGRCDYFINATIENQKIKDYSAFENECKNQDRGAGTCAAQKVYDIGTEKLITMNVGPNAYKAIQDMGIEMYKGVSGTIKSNIEKLLNDELEEIKEPSRPGRGGGRRN